nr:transcriptional regulator NrdR [uncultured Leptotrichia sp.]
MKCPYCGSDNTKVIDSRSYSDGNSIKRRRECEECQKRFTTHEKVVDLTLFVIKKNGEKQLYSREKVYNGIIRALEKRNINMEKIEEILDKLEREILTNFSGEIKSSQLGDKIVSYLLDLDEVAYVRFASVYKKFDNLDSFVKEIEKIKNEKNIKGKMK